ncbi:MAG: hypothetical protein N2450_06985 [bacterium]|nr:hypothetical protein [bacterium]
MQRLKLFLCGIFILLGSCKDPERTNPLDPKSLFYRVHSTVILQILTFQNQPKSSVHVRLGETVQVSNQEGIVEFYEVVPDTYQICIYGIDIASDTINIIVPPSSIVRQQFQVNRLPIFDSVSVISELRTSGIYNARCHFYAKCYDLDGRYDVDSVYVVTPYGNIHLASSPDSTYRYSIDTLPNGQSLHNLVGHPLNFVAVDNDGGISQTIRTLARIFHGSPFILAPLNNATDLVSEFYVEWFASSNDYFSFHFRVIIFNFSNGTEILRVDRIPQNQYRLNLYNTLSPGFYFVEVHEVDSFGNFSRSNRNAFQLINSAK